MGETTGSLCSSRARAIWVLVRPRFSASSESRSTIRLSASLFAPYLFCARASVSYRAVLSFHARDKRPAANDCTESGRRLYPCTRAPFLILLRGISDCSGSAWRPTLSSHAFPRYAALSETARPTLPKPRYSGLVGFHHIVQGFHGFFDGCARVPSVDDVEINVVHAQSLQAVVDPRLGWPCATVRRRWGHSS